MSTVAILSDGMAIRVDADKPNRPAVVLKVWQRPATGSWCAIVIFGTKQTPAAGVKPVPILIDPKHPEYKALGLTVATYFKNSHCGQIADDDRSIVIKGSCSPELLIALRQLAGFR